MRFRWTVLLAVLVLADLVPRSIEAQGAPPQTPPRKPAVAGLGQNWPNPMNPETWIKFTVGDYPACTESGREYQVSLRILNALQQLIAIPVLQRGAGAVAGGQQINRLRLTCGEYTAYWNGRYLNSQQEAASGVYLYELGVDGQRIVRRMMVSK